MPDLHSPDGGRPVDLTVVRRGFERRFTEAGFTHPDVAAAVVTARGAAALTQQEWSEKLGLDIAPIAAAEAGDTGWEHLPQAILDALADC